jgi:hypothetical protein
MAKTVIEYKCLLISPSDVEAERKAISEVISSWNAQIGESLGTRIELVKWESHSVPEMGDVPQAILNRQLVDNCDFGIAVFWSRLGTPTADHDSGSVEEIEKLMERGAIVRTYFSRKSLPHDVDLTQMEKLRKIRTKFEVNGLLGKYNDIADLREQVILHLTKTVAELLVKDKGFATSAVNDSTSTLKKPDIRIKFAPAYAQTWIDGVKSVFTIQVQNHSNMKVFMGMVRMLLNDGRQLVFTKDSLTGQPQTRRELLPGESFSVNILPEDIFENATPDEVVGVAVTDDIDRAYELRSEEVKDSLKAIWGKYKSKT